MELFEDLNHKLEAMPEFNQESIEKLFIDFLAEKEIKLRKLAQPLRVALTGKTASPGIFEVMEVLGREKVIERISKAVSHIKKKQDG